ncbi:hypothetical protein [Streptomyces acidicola]|uniref:hypothetical protein n=1 Tax=Streptomyces acidicola TaxID=2596892 RepID=UPI00382C228B
MGSTPHFVVLGEADVDMEELDSLTTELRRLLLELDVEDVRRVRSDGRPPEGAKPGELLTVGALAVSLAPAVLLPALRLVETWIQSRPIRMVRVELDGRSIELGHATSEQQQRLVDAFLEDAGTPRDDEPQRSDDLRLPAPGQDA